MLGKNSEEKYLGKKIGMWEGLKTCEYLACLSNRKKAGLNEAEGRREEWCEMRFTQINSLKI